MVQGGYLKTLTFKFLNFPKVEYQQKVKTLLAQKNYQIRNQFQWIVPFEHTEGQLLNIPGRLNKKAAVDSNKHDWD